MLFAEEGERFFLYDPTNPGEILLVVKVRKIQRERDYAMDLEIFLGRQCTSYHIIKRRDRKLNLPFPCYIGVGANKNGLPALMIETDYAYNIAREILYRESHGSSCTLRGNPNKNPFELRYAKLPSLDEKMHSKVPIFGELYSRVET